MKRLVFMAVMVAFILGTVGMAQAVEIKAQGDWQMSVNYIKNPNLDKDLDDDPFQAVQRFRTIFEFIANENLKGVVRFNTNTLRSGANAGRGSLDIGTRNDVWDLDVAHLDFMIPNTQVNVKAGLQPVALPNTLGAHILDDNVWAFTASSQFNDMLGLTVGWARLADFKAGGVDTTGDGLIDSKNKDEVDMFMAIVPVTMDGFQINPFMAYARLGKNALNDDVDADGDPDYTDGNYETSNLFHAGINFTVDMFDPIKIMGDFNYGSMSKYYDDGANRTDVGATAGWIADLAVAYQMDMMTPMIFGLYESGESSSSFREDKKGKIMPNVLSPDNAGISSFGFGGSSFRNAGYKLGLDGATGKMAVGFKLEDITFVEKLNHMFNIVYYKGTNDKNSVNTDGDSLFTTDDSAWEVNFDSKYQMYENLAAIVELGYLNVDKDDNTMDDAAWKAAAGFRYKF